MIYRQIHAYQTNPSAVIVCEGEALSIRRADEVIGCDNDGFILEGPDVDIVEPPTVVLKA
jgi:hypothetical protein